MSKNSVHFTHTMSLPKDLYNDDTEVVQEEGTPTLNDQGQTLEDLITFSTLQQFLQKARNMNVCSTTRIIDLPSRAINPIL